MEASFDLRGSNGFRMQFDDLRGVATVALTGSIGPSAVGSVAYETRGQVEGDRLKARFGGFGKVDVVFKPSGGIGHESAPRGCTGKPLLKRRGVFVGTITFRGEQGYTTVHATRAKGTLSTLPHWKCKEPTFPHGTEAGQGQTTELQAISPRTGVFLSVSATRPAGKRGTTFFFASSFEHHGNMRVGRVALVAARESSFVFDDALGSATVEPPAPFSGSATFLRNPADSQGWAGSLKVELPGKTLSLVGNSFQARLFHRTPDGIGG